MNWILRLTSVLCNYTLSRVFMSLIGLVLCVNGCLGPKQGQKSLMGPEVTQETVVSLNGETGPEQPVIPVSTVDAARKVQELEDENAKLHLRILEQEAFINDLNDRLINTQKELNGAVDEVVRVKARLKSLDSRAEAASSLAEAEIALRTIKRNSNEQTTQPEIKTAEELLFAADQEFKKENYSGSLYLSNRIQSVVPLIKNDGVEIPFSKDEYRYKIPLKLKTNARSNLRQGPGLNYEILTIIERNETLIGLSTQDRWIRVQTENGQNGWIYYQLVTEKQHN